jgi:hypothetical protein
VPQRETGSASSEGKLFDIAQKLAEATRREANSKGSPGFAEN